MGDLANAHARGGNGGGGAIDKKVTCDGDPAKPGRRLFLLVAGIAAFPISFCLAQQPRAPEALGFMRYYKCPSDKDVDRLGDTGTAEACLAACAARSHGVGCWWLDGTGGFPKQCRICRTMQPSKQDWPNDWALPFSTYMS